MDEADLRNLGIFLDRPIPAADNHQMPADGDLVQRVTPSLVRARFAFHTAVGLAALTAYFMTTDPRPAAMAAVLAVALTIPQLTEIRKRLQCILVVDTLAAVAAWWMLGPTAGPDFVLLVIAGIAGLALAGAQWRLLIGLVLAAEFAQIPLHFWAKSGTEPPLFHSPAQVVGNGEFVAGVLVRLLILALTALLFRFVGRRLVESRLALTQSESTFKGAFQEAPIGVALIDEHANLIRINERVEKLLNGKGDRAKTEDLTHPEDRPILGAGVAEVLSGMLRRFEAELRSQPDPSQATRFLRFSVSPVETPGRVAGVMTIEDVTQRVANEKRLEELVRSKDEFVASVSHELRTPLTAVVGFADILSTAWKDLPPEELASLIGDIVRESREVASIVEDLLVIARADIGTVTLFPDQLDIEEEIGAVLAGLRPDSRDQIVLYCEACWAWGDATRFRQILRNLLANAFRYGGDRVELTAHLVGDHIEIVVADNGPGIDAEDPELIFQPYVRAHENKTQPASVGLGLAVSRSLARAMGGDLTYTRVNDMTTFRLTIPPARIPIRVSS